MKAIRWTFENLKGQLVVLSVWSENGNVDKSELGRLKAEYSGKRVAFVGLQFRSRPQLEVFLKKFNLECQPDFERELPYDLLHKRTLPFNLVIDREGKVKSALTSCNVFKGELEKAIVAHL